MSIALASSHLQKALYGNASSFNHRASLNLDPLRALVAERSSRQRIDGALRRKLAPLDAIHPGRKPRHLQPTRQELCALHRKAEPLLDFPRFWIDDVKRQAIGDAFAKVIAERKYTVWACAILSNHAHMLVRRHRDDARVIWRQLANASFAKLHAFTDVAFDHPVWSTRPYKVFLYAPTDLRRLIAYIERNPENEECPGKVSRSS
jgi:REP element-mobilizing transposase RayT